MSDTEQAGYLAVCAMLAGAAFGPLGALAVLILVVLLSSRGGA